eukprot:TRINITY_DN307_c0_g2_i1.p1 TRINITY_DN307_c0_g2~~TRINITY_DN307_c0_g2_i1.p1  ORF type:complete len:313 (+),score=31.16 TRINITY_DN307_c0_g2_i1:66-941(+)
MGGCFSASGDPNKPQYPAYCVAEPDVTPERLQLVRSSWQAIFDGETEPYLTLKKEHPCKTSLVFFFDTFYNRLFEVAPNTRPLFKNNMDVQGRALVKMLHAAISRLLVHPELKTLLRECAERHNSYGATVYDFHTMGEVLLFTLQACLGPQYTDPVRTAWLHVYSMMVQIMIPKVKVFERPEIEPHSELVKQPEVDTPKPVASENSQPYHSQASAPVSPSHSQSQAPALALAPKAQAEVEVAAEKESQAAPKPQVPVPPLEPAPLLPSSQLSQSPGAPAPEADINIEIVES